MDDKPAVEYHPFGTITLNFDDGAVKLRRCRLGDLQFGKDLMAEIRTGLTETVQMWLDQILEYRDGLPAPESSEEERTAFFAALTPDQRKEMGVKVDKINQMNEQVKAANRDAVYRWLAPVAERMGDGPVPAMEEWPLEILDVTLSDIIDHWQTRPLASGKTLGNNRTTLEAANSGPPPLTVSSPPAQQPQ